MDDPTRGIDVGANTRLQTNERTGRAGHCHHHDLQRSGGSAGHERPGHGDVPGPVNGTLDTSEATQEKIMALATGIA